MKHLILILLVAATYPNFCKDYESGKDPIDKRGFYCQGARIEKLLERMVEAAEIRLNKWE